LLRSVGRSLSWLEVRVSDLESGEEAPAGEVGEIWVRSGQNMKGYWNQPEATAQTLVEGGWLRTGDGAYRDEEGYFFLQDRIKDMIISGGENVYPAEVENALAHHPAVADVAVIGVPHERWGETVKAVVILASGAEATPEELIEFARSRLARYKCPTSVDFADELPRTPTGKVMKKELRAQYA
jgi:acyl-CoA synthetase (AMP-forming)/AMP-acid ligase II